MPSLPTSGMTLDGTCYPLRMWERITSEKDGGYWPTPAANKTTESGEIVNRDGTPWNGMGKPHSKTTGKPITTALADAVKMWPTPRAHNSSIYAEDDATYQDRDKKGGAKSLAREVKMWPTPTACAGQNPGAHGQGGQNLATVAGGQLNPTWVEWLMGYPSEWTVLEDWAMQWCRPKREKPLKG